MKYTTRVLRAQHLPGCLPLLADRHLYDDAERELLLRFWKELLLEGRSYGGLSFRGDGDGEEILAFSISVFISDEMAEYIHCAREPHVGRRFFQAWLRGVPLFLNDREIGLANGGSGVNVLTIHNGYRRYASMTEYADLRMSLVEVFIREHLGLHIRSFAHELYGEYRETVLAGGLRIREYDDIAVAETPPELRPFMTMLSRHGAADQRGNYLSDSVAFGFAVPRFGFSAVQRQLLRAARERDADEYTAAMLHLSLPAIKKRWSSIYERIERVDPGFLGKVDDRTSGRRGQEYRRKVMAYVRDHPEELHPYTPAVAAAARVHVISEDLPGAKTPLDERVSTE